MDKDMLDARLELLQEKAQLVSSLRRLGYDPKAVIVDAVRSLRAEMEMLLFALAEQLQEYED